MSQYPILLVEDNQDNQQLVCWMLEDADYEVVCADTAEEGLEQLASQNFSAVLMDISLPGMDGKEATRTIRQDSTNGTLPIFALTAHIIDEETKEIMAAGVNAILTKPVDEGLLLHKLSELP